MSAAPVRGAGRRGGPNTACRRARRVPARHRPATRASRGALAVVVAVAAAAAGIAAAGPAHGQEPRTAEIWLGPALHLGRGLGDFGAANPDWGVGPGFVMTIRPLSAALGGRVDAGFATLGGPAGDVVLSDSLGPVAGRAETSTRVSWALFGVQWEREAGDVAVVASLLAGFGGSRVEATSLEGLALDPSGRPASHRGFAWGGGLGLRKRLPWASNVAGALEVAYRALPGADYVAAPPFERDTGDSRYRVARGTVHAVVAQLAVHFTRQ